MSQKRELAWLSSDITKDRAPDLRSYLVGELEVTEITPENIIRQLDQKFLKAQPDSWILKLYEFFNEQRSASLRRWLADVPLIRLEDETHVVPKADGRPAAFLPSESATEFPTVRCSVCATEPAPCVPPSRWD